MTRVVMLVTSELDRDPRVQKEARSAVEAGYEVTVICRSYTGEPMPYDVVPLGVGRRSHVIAKILERVWTNVALFSAAMRSKGDLVHANDLDTLPAGYLAARITGAKVLYDAHELWSESGGRGGRLGRESIVAVERRLCKHVDSVVTVSRLRGEYMAELLGIPEPVVVMNTPFYAAPDSLAPGAWLEQFAGKHVVLYQGRFSPGMGLEEAILAGHYLPDDVVLVFRGYGSIEDDLKDLVRNEGLAGKVAFMPAVPMNDLVKSAVGADLGLVVYKPINKNNLYAAPNKLFEFITAGVPCVGSDLPYVREILCDHGLGVLFIPGDSKDMARAILALLNSPDTLAQMRQRCLEMAPRFSWQVEGAKLMQEYQRLLNSAR